ncbi:MAG: hypothetical protein OHK0012_19840 [Synechococcales cyanobacterium]
MHLLSRVPTTEMEVTSIRLERELKERLKDLAGDQGYQALIREVLWQYVQQAQGSPQARRDDIRVYMPATTTQEEHCALTGERIAAQSPMYLGLTKTGSLVPLSVASVSQA